MSKLSSVNHSVYKTCLEISSVAKWLNDVASLSTVPWIHASSLLSIVSPLITVVSSQNVGQFTQ